MMLAVVLLLCVPKPALSAPKTSSAPFGLTSSDGEGLQFVRLEVSALVQRPLAYVELHMVFANPADRVREGRFAITATPMFAPCEKPAYSTGPSATRPGKRARKATRPASISASSAPAL